MSVIDWAGAASSTSQAPKRPRAEPLRGSNQLLLHSRANRQAGDIGIGASPQRRLELGMPSTSSDGVFGNHSYRLALEIHFELILRAKTPDDALNNLRSLTRWLELLGADNVVQWIRQLVRTEAPGTWYVDKHDREQYVRNVDLSPNMRDYLSSFEKRVKAHATAKLEHVLRSTST